MRRSLRLNAQAQAAAAPRTTFAELPRTALVAILQSVPRPQRLKNCARVCAAWADAAAEATLEVDICWARWYQRSEHMSASASSLGAWLGGRGRGVRQLQCATKGPFATLNATAACLQLQCGGLPNLQQLELVSVTLQFSTAGAAAPPIVLPALRSIRLERCRISPSSLAMLQRLPQQLTRLELDRITLAEETADAQQQQQQPQPAATRCACVTAGVAGVLAQLPQLSVLQLCDVDLDAAALQPLSNMQQLQALSMTTRPLRPTPARFTASTILRLCSHLTSLEVEARMFAGPGDLDAAGMPVLWPSALGSLTLRSVQLRPHALDGATSVTRLVLDRCPVHPHLDTGGWHPDNLPDLMGMLACMTSLQSIELIDSTMFIDPEELPSDSDDDDNDEDDDDDADSAELDALSASISALWMLPHLTSLQLRSTFGQPLRRGILQRILPPGSRLPNLAQLAISSGDERELCYEPPPPGNEYYARNWSLTAADVDAIAAACPSLRALDLSCVLRGRPEVVASLVQLQQRVGLSKLVIGDWSGFLTDGAAAGLAQMATSLRELDILCGTRLSDVGLLHLVQLTRLQRLRIGGCALSHGVGWQLEAMDDPPVQVLLTPQPRQHFMAPTTRVQTVAEQLMERLRESDKFARAVHEHLLSLHGEVRDLKQVQLEQTARLEQLEAQLEEKDQQLAEKGEQLALLANS